MSINKTVCGTSTGWSERKNPGWTQAECLKRLVIERWHTNVFFFQQCCYLHEILITTDVK